jgi:hypothetical protein
MDLGDAHVGELGHALVGGEAGVGKPGCSDRGSDLHRMVPSLTPGEDHRASRAL